MKEHCPLLPRIAERALQLCDIVHDAETTLGVGMVEGIRDRGSCIFRGGFGYHLDVGVFERRRLGQWLCSLGLTADRQFQQRLCRFTWQMLHQVEEAVFVGVAYVLQPFIRNATAQEIAVGYLGEQQRFRRRLRPCLHDPRHSDLLNRLPHFHQLRRTRLRMDLQPAAYCPLVGVIMVVHVTKHGTVGGPMYDDPNVETDAHGPKIRIFRFSDFVETESWLRGRRLQVEGCGLRRLLLFTGQFGEAVGECIRNKEAHLRSRL